MKNGAAREFQTKRVMEGIKAVRSGRSTPIIPWEQKPGKKKLKIANSAFLQYRISIYIAFSYFHTPIHIPGADWKVPVPRIE